MGFIINPYAFGAKSFAVVDTDFSTTDLTTYTFSAQTLGEAHATRKIIVAIAGVSGATSRTISSVTVDGVTATAVITRINSGNSRNGHASIYIADVPSNTTGDVVVTWSGSMLNTMIGLYSAINFSSSTAHDSDPDSDIDDQNNMTVNVPDQGCVVAARAIVGATSGTWTGVTEDNDQNTGDGDSISVGGQGLLAAETSRAVTSTTSGTPSRFCCASFG